MDIFKYIAFFHDGLLFDIHQNADVIEFAMSSSEMNDEDIVDGIALSKSHSIQGKLHIEGVKGIKINKNPIDSLHKTYDYGQILDFELTEKSVEFGINWISLPPKPKINEFETIEIEAEKLWWENIPDLEDKYP